MHHNLTPHEQAGLQTSLDFLKARFPDGVIIIVDTGSDNAPEGLRSYVIASEMPIGPRLNMLRAATLKTEQLNDQACPA